MHFWAYIMGGDLVKVTAESLGGYGTKVSVDWYELGEKPWKRKANDVYYTTEELDLWSDEVDEVMDVFLGDGNEWILL